MSNGHPKQRRGAAHARHGPQRPERVASPSANANGARQANNQPTSPNNGSGNGSGNGAKRPAKANESRAALQPLPKPAATPAADAAPAANGQPAGTAKTAKSERAAPTPPARSTLPVVRRGRRPVIVPPPGRVASADSGPVERLAPTDSSGVAPGERSAPELPSRHATDAFFISLAQRDLEVAIEATSVELFSIEVERIDTVVELEVVSSAGDPIALAGAPGEAEDTLTGDRSAPHGDGAAGALGPRAAGEDADSADTADTAPALPVAPTPRARVGRFYAPGGPPRPDESWVDHTPSSAANAAVNHDAQATLSSARFSAPATPPPFPIPEHVEHFDHSARVGPRDDLGRLIDSLHTLFEQDRAVASQMGTARCGLCYLHFPLADLDYRDQEGFYVCPACHRSLGGANVPMVRRQQR